MALRLGRLLAVLAILVEADPSSQVKYNSCLDASDVRSETTALLQAATSRKAFEPESGAAINASKHEPDHRRNATSSRAPPTLAEALEADMLGGKSAKLASFLGVLLALGIIIFELCHMQCMGVDLSGPFPLLERTQLDQDSAREGPLMGSLRLWSLYLAERARFGLTFIFVIGAMVSMSQYANLLLVQWSNDFWGKLPDWSKGKHGSSHWHEFEALLLQFLAFAFMALFASAYRIYSTAVFNITVRESVTRRYSSKWLSSFSSYRLEVYKQGNDAGAVDNPDQRIQEDVWTFITSSVSLLVDIINNVIQFCIFSAQVYRYSPTAVLGFSDFELPGWLLWVCLLYASMSTYCTYLASKKLEALEGTNQCTEASFRFELTTVRCRAETIALARSEDVHVKRLEDRFGMLRRSFWETMAAQKRYLILASFFEQAEVVVPLFLLGPSFLAGDIDFGGLMAASRSVSLLNGSLLWLATSYVSIAQFRASTGRLTRFEDAITAHMKEASGGAEVQESPPGTGLSVQSLTVWMPRRKCKEDDEVHGSMELQQNEQCLVSLLENLSMDFNLGARVLVQGASGAGKSTFLRALSGAWPFAKGQVQVPGGEAKMLVFPAEIFVPPGSLRDALCYPAVPNTKAGMADSDIEAALEVVGLEELLNQSGAKGCIDGLETVQEWDLALSSGQKARLALARLLLHRPACAALDEPVAHLQASARAPVLKRVLEALGSDSVVLVVSHDVSAELTALFDTFVTVDQERKTLEKHAGSFPSSGRDSVSCATIVQDLRKTFTSQASR